MNRLARVTALTLALVMVLPLVGSVAAQDEGKTLIIALGPGDPRSIDPQQGINVRDLTLINLLFPGLTVLDEVTREVQPGLAESWEISEDGLVYTFKLVEEIPWVRYNAEAGEVDAVLDPDGNPRYVTAHDVVFGWLRALNPETASPAAYILAPYITGGEAFNAGEGSAEDVGIKAIDDYTFEVTAPEKVGFALGIYGLLNARPVPEWSIDEAGTVWIEPENINSYGPFALKEWAHEESMTFVKNPFWPGTESISQPKLDTVVVRFLDEVVALREYEAGAIDVASAVPADQLDRIRADETLSQELTIISGLCSQAWGFHTEKPPFDNVHIRRAFSYAVDRQSLVDNITKGGEIPAPWFTPPSISMAPTLEDNPDLGIHFDPDKAMEELQLGLEELGLTSVDELPSITVVFGNTPALSATGQALQQMWANTLGVQVELSALDTTTYWSTMMEDAGQIHRAGWCPDYNDANNYLRDVMHSESIYNYGHWNSPEFDALVDEARVLDDPDRRRELYAQIENLMIVEEAAIIPLYWPAYPSLTKPYVERTYEVTGVQAFWKWDVN